MSKIHTYDGKNLEIRYDVRRCIHAAECVKGAPQVFSPKNRPWVQPDAADADHVSAVIHRCPTGALTYTRKDGGSAEEAPTENTVRVEKDGPVYLHGKLEIEDAKGTVRDETRVALCRCGASHNKPYCDGSHAKADFKDPGVVGDARTKDADGDQTTLRAKVTPSGPVLLEGPHRLVDADGNTVKTTGTGYLCRCGRSQNRPFCDGSHKDGFEDAGVFSD